MTASVSTSSPRATFTNVTPAFIFSIYSSLIMYFVLGSRGTCRLTMSARL